MSEVTTVQALNEKTAIHTALEIERVEAVLKQMKASLKAYVDKQGPLQVGDRIWDNYTTTSWVFAADKLKELAVAVTVEGKNPWEYLSLPAASIKKLGWEEAALSQYGTLKVSNRFESKKA
ncbi:hypothetical protein J1TS5_03410 [Paenibacillus macerans]|uniref:hypothetical protein n=1 Tax=Paenibacillus macerans TaxID=44252 RepID=UPI001B1B983B|nr:hypothetical protein [Paenibacillus macerans]GIP08171.1 hypothetical protein J1TS5_03410 [Paenibacillus macerans]